jgi:hypothetical protein
MLILHQQIELDVAIDLIKISLVFEGRLNAKGFSKRYRSQGRLVCWGGLYRPALGGKPIRRKQEIFMKS